MDQNTRVIDYIIEQAEIFDIKNLGFERDTIDNILRLYRKYTDNVNRIIDVHGDISSMLKMQQLIMRIEDATNIFYNAAARELSRATFDYVATSYTQFDQLIEVGFEVENKARKYGISEMSGKKIFDQDSLEYLNTRSLEQVKGITNGIMDKVRSGLGELLLQGRGSKGAVREKIQSIMETTKSRAEMIAQTELSMAYNTGVLHRMEDFNAMNPGKTMMKYWHGFKYSITTCTYCRPKIGGIYRYDDMTYVLPAHPRCRCVWLPFMQGWDKPISTIFTRNANMLERAYTPDEIYMRINTRLGIDYAKYIEIDKATKYLSGDRTKDTMKGFGAARDFAIDDTKSAFDIVSAANTERMSNEFNTQLGFWKDYVATNVVDRDLDALRRSHEAIKGVMILPWTAEQLTKWDNLLNIIRKYI